MLDRTRWIRTLGAIALLAIFLAPTAVLGDYADLRILEHSVSADGSRLKVVVSNPGEPTTAAISASAVVGGVVDFAQSQTFFIRTGETLTVYLEFSGPINFITEGPDPIPGP